MPGPSGREGNASSSTDAEPLAPTQLRELLLEALRAPECEPVAPPPPLGYLQPALDAVDERLLALLAALHCFFAAEAEGLPHVPGLRALFVRYPASRPRIRAAEAGYATFTQPMNRRQVYA
jgi:hypothetical protein